MIELVAGQSGELIACDVEAALCQVPAARITEFSCVKSS